MERALRIAIEHHVTLDVTRAALPFVTLPRTLALGELRAKVTKWKKWKDPRFHSVRVT